MSRSVLGHCFREVNHLVPSCSESNLAVPPHDFLNFTVAAKEKYLGETKKLKSSLIALCQSDSILIYFSFQCIHLSECTHLSTDSTPHSHYHSARLFRSWGYC